MRVDGGTDRRIQREWRYVRRTFPGGVRIAGRIPEGSQPSGGSCRSDPASEERRRFRSAVAGTHGKVGYVPRVRDRHRVSQSPAEVLEDQIPGVPGRWTATRREWPRWFRSIPDQIRTPTAAAAG